MRRTHQRTVLGLYRTRYEPDLFADALNLGVTALDTSYNYRGFTAHRTLAAQAADLLPEFEVSTKVGFFPSAHGPLHSLQPRRLRTAVEQTADTLGQVPAVVFLHNPEHSLRALPDAAARDQLAAACTCLADAAAAGLCGAWGIATWDPRPLAAVLVPAGPEAIPSPEVLMTRSGLLLSPSILTAAERLAALLGVPEEGRWGMSPFGGDAAHPVWENFDGRAFLTGHPDCSPLQAGYRVAFELPRVARVAVGTGDAQHLRALVDAATLEVSGAVLDRFRVLLAERRRVSAA